MFPVDKIYDGFNFWSSPLLQVHLGETTMTSEIFWYDVDLPFSFRNFTNLSHFTFASDAYLFNFFQTHIPPFYSLLKLDRVVGGFWANFSGDHCNLGFLVTIVFIYIYIYIYIYFSYNSLEPWEMENMWSGDPLL